MTPILRAAASALLLGSLVACGGGGGSSPAPAPAGPCASGAAYVIATQTATLDGAGAAAAVLGCAGPIGDPRWVQTAGPAVALLAERTQTIHFEPPSAGTYRFALDFTDPGGARRSETVSVDVGTSSAVRLALRNAQAVRMGGNVSVRLWPLLAAGDAVQSITWAQIEGPAVVLDTSDPYVALFVAPTVGHDTPIRLRATMRTAAGVTAVDEVLVVVERHVQAAQSDPSTVWGGSHVSRVYAYRPAGPYAGVLQRCVFESTLRYSGAAANLCPTSQLPFLAQETGGAVPTVEQVMDRVLVSNDWLGANFETFLRQSAASADFRRMMMSVTAVVLGTQVRPSFYYALTGAIYLDADNFWLTPQERDTVNEAPDFRSDFDRDLAYSGVWRYTRDSASIFRVWDPRARIGRTVADLQDESAWLLYHELGHALDFLPPSQYAGLLLASASNPWQIIGPRYAGGQLASDSLAANFPLTSSVMAGLAQVKFQGATANATQIAYSPNDVAAFFSADRATDEYNYSTRYEDLAMTLEETLMSRRLGIRRDVAITDKIGPTTTGSNLIVRWGQRGRVGEAAIKPRARSAVSQLAPWADVNAVDALAAPIPMRAGDSWSGNLVLPAPSGRVDLLAAEAPWVAQWRLRQEMRRSGHALHRGAKALPDRGF